MADFSGHYGYQEIMGQTRSTGARYSGVRNQGATCYLNSVLQCLYMTEDFRKEVENFRPDSSNIHMESSQSNDLMLELKNLFKKMKETDGTTEGITQSLRISNVHEQQDAVEYYQKILKAANSQASKIFEGVMSNNTTCPNNHIFIEKHHFFTIPLAIEVGHSGTFDMLRGLQTFFDLVKLDEDNWLYCKDCGEKTETRTWTDIKVFPTILTLYLKRFYFDYNQMRPVKNHCFMNISPKLEIKNIGYSLYAVINHFGDESGGHYNVCIKSFEDGEWYLFDDSSVTQVSKNFFRDCSKTAFLLMYRKLDSLHAEEKSTDEPCFPPNLVKVNGEAHLSYVASLKGAWQVVSDQVKVCLEKVDQLAGQMHTFRQCYDWLIQWIAVAKKWLKDIEAHPVSDKKAQKKQLAQAKELLVEIENKADKVKECKNQAFAYMNLIKDHEHKLEACRAFVESFRFTSVGSTSNSIMEEIINLEKCYSEVLLLTQYIHFKMDIHKEDNEVLVKQPQKKELPEPRNLSDEEIKCKSQQVQEALLSQNKIEENNTEVDSFRKVAQEAAEKHGKPANEDTLIKRKSKEKLKQNLATEQEAVQQTHKAKEDCETFKQQAEEDAGEDKECTDKEANQHPQNTHETEQQNQAPEAEAAKHAKAQEHSEKQLRNMPKMEGKNEFHLTHAVASQGRFNKITTESQNKFSDATSDKKKDAQPLKKCKFDKENTFLVEGLRKQVTVEQLLQSQVIDQETYKKVINGSISMEDLSKHLKKYLDGTNCIAGVYIEDTKEQLSNLSSYEEEHDWARRCH